MFVAFCFVPSYSTLFVVACRNNAPRKFGIHISFNFPHSIVRSDRWRRHAEYGIGRENFAGPRPLQPMCRTPHSQTLRTPAEEGQSHSTCAPTQRCRPRNVYSRLTRKKDARLGGSAHRRASGAGGLRYHYHDGLPTGNHKTRTKQLDN